MCVCFRLLCDLYLLISAFGKISVQWPELPQAEPGLGHVAVLVQRVLNQRKSVACIALLNRPSIYHVLWVCIDEAGHR